jgi:hypothetical protein
LTGTGSVSGAYGSAEQIISGGVVNLINVPPATYKIRVTDTENGVYAEKNFSATYQAPSAPYDISPTSLPQGTNKGPLAVRAKGMYGNCSFTIKFWRMDWVVFYFHGGDTYNTSLTSPAVTYSRADKWVQISANVNVPTQGFLNIPSYKTANGALHEIMVTNAIGGSPYWTGGHPTI